MKMAAAARTPRRADFISYLLRVAMTMLVIGWITMWFLGPLKVWVSPVDHIFEQNKHILFWKGWPQCQKPTASIWTYPIFIGGPLGMVTGGELLILLIFLGLLVWSLSFHIANGLDKANHMKIQPGIKLWQQRLSVIAARLGSVGTLCLSFLFFPVTRGPVLLQQFNVPFEISVKYHIWLGNMAMVLLTAHGMSYVFLWEIRHILPRKLSSWRKIGYSNIAGEIALLAGLIIWLTSIRPIRQRFFEVFYYTHHLYLVFIVFFALHVGDVTFSLALPGIFLFLLDRYIRFLQSQKAVHVISATKLPSNIVHLVIAKHPSVVYNPMSVILLNIPLVSHLEWHPFSIISTSSIDSDRLCVLIKCQQGWTKKLDEFLANLSSRESPFHLQAAIEGPYGPAASDFLRYDTLILIGGGSGIAPLLSILSEILHQHNIKKENHVPSEVLFIWSVKTSEELCILNLISPTVICPNYSEIFKLEMRAYVTQTKDSDNEMAILDMEKMTPPTTSCFTNYQIKEANYKKATTIMGCVCSITTSNHTLWQAAVVASALVGYLIFMGLLNHFYIYPLDHNTYEVYPWWARGLLTIVCMIVGIVIFGGLVFMVWSMKKGNRVYKSAEELYEVQTTVNLQERQNHTILNQCSIHYGQRPDLQDIIGELAMKMGGKNVGVIVCGPEGMQQSVASACRSHTSFLGVRSSVAVLNFHSISYNL